MSRRVRQPNTPTFCWTPKSQLWLRRVMVGLLLVALVAPAASASAQSELDAARDRAEAAANAADDARDAAAEAQARADALAEAVEDAVHAAEDVDAQIKVVEVRAEAAQVEVNALAGIVADLMVQRYMYGDQQQSDFVVDGSLESRATADALARFATLGVGDEVDRYRVVTDDLAAANAELVSLRAELETALQVLHANEAQMTVELETITAQLAIAEAQEATLADEVDRLEAEERARIEAERRRREAERQRVAEERRQAAAAEAAAAEAERQRQQAESDLTSTTTSTPPTTQPAATETAPTETSPTETSPTDTAPTETAPTETTPPTTAAPEIRGSGSMLCPIGGSTSFSDTWGAARSGGRSHKGVDMFATRGTPVVAPVSGTVRHTTNSLGGLAFYLDGDDGNRYYGAHLDSFGESGNVAAGTVVGTVGNTGNARYASPHLHFEIMPGGGSSVNPTPAVRAACG